MSLTSRLGRLARRPWRGLRHDSRTVARATTLVATLLATLTTSLAVACGGAADDTPGAGAIAHETAIASPTTSLPARDVAPAGTMSPGGFGVSIGFRSTQRLNEHYAKHGAEFGSITREEYLRQAQSLRDAAVGGSVLELERGDGTVSRFDRTRGAFLAFDPDGTIRTFFRPNDGEAYFRRQALRRRNP